MASLDYDVGFLEEPRGLEGFLSERGYIVEDERSFRTYVHEDLPIELLYGTPEHEEGTVPDWEGAGFKVVKDLLISSKDYDMYEEMDKLVNDLADHYKTVFFDGNEYY
jgi:hypothetical protein